MGFPFPDMPVMGASVVTLTDLRTLVEHMNSKLLVQANAIRALQEEAFRAKETEMMSVNALTELKGAAAQVSHEVGYLKQERVEVLERELLISNEEAANQKRNLAALEASLEEFRAEVRGPLFQEVLTGLDAAVEDLRIDFRKVTASVQDWEQKLGTTSGEVASLAEDLRVAKVMSGVETDSLRGLVSDLETKERALQQQTKALEFRCLGTRWEPSDQTGAGEDDTAPEKVKVLRSDEESIGKMPLERIGTSHEDAILKLMDELQNLLSTNGALKKDLEESTSEMRSFVKGSDAWQQATGLETARAHERLDTHNGELGKAQEILASLRLFVDEDLRRHVSASGQRFEELTRELQKAQVRLQTALDHELPGVREEVIQLRGDQERDREDVAYLLSHKQDFERVPEMRDDVDESLARTLELRSRAQSHEDAIEALQSYQAELKRVLQTGRDGNVSLKCGNATLTLSMPEMDPENTMTQQLIDTREKLDALEQEKQGLLDKVGKLRDKALNM